MLSFLFIFWPHTVPLREHSCLYAQKSKYVFNHNIHRHMTIYANTYVFWNAFLFHNSCLNELIKLIHKTMSALNEYPGIGGWGGGSSGKCSGTQSCINHEFQPSSPPPLSSLKTLLRTLTHSFRTLVSSHTFPSPEHLP